MKSYKDFKKNILKDEKVKKEYNKLEPEYELIQLIIKQRLDKGLTQAGLAKKIGTKQSAISRLECGMYNPSLAFLQKIAKALDKKLHVCFQ